MPEYLLPLLFSSAVIWGNPNQGFHPVPANIATTIAHRSAPSSHRCASSTLYWLDNDGALLEEDGESEESTEDD